MLGSVEQLLPPRTKSNNTSLVPHSSRASPAAATVLDDAQRDHILSELAFPCGVSLQQLHPKSGGENATNGS
ncbi:hypothetical protein PC116_g26166 [Phytophthora cactorum]|nr:hypothetical protein PC128_g19301 [Phytophthora cactorum]KAG4225402.1 hypothetical protein PC116_g26166 [Phytophthora cactorum]